jgi:hypothetical protein
MTVRKSADLATSIEITEAFRKVSPDDPVKYDFAITRLGIRDELEPSGFIEECRTDQTVRPSGRKRGAKRREK